MCDTHFFFLLDSVMMFFFVETALVCCVDLDIYLHNTEYPLGLFRISFVFAKIRIYDVVQTCTEIYSSYMCMLCVVCSYRKLRVCMFVFVCACAFSAILMQSKYNRLVPHIRCKMNQISSIENSSQLFRCLI